MAKYTITITFDSGDFKYSCKKEGDKDPQKGRKHKVPVGENDVVWTSKSAWAIQFDGSTPLPLFEYRAAASEDGTVTAGAKIHKDVRGRFKYWVAISKDDQLYLDDPEMIVEP